MLAVRQALNQRPLAFAVLCRNGAPEEIRTPDPQIRSLVLYPAELRVPLGLALFRVKRANLIKCGANDKPCSSGLANRWVWKGFIER